MTDTRTHAAPTFLPLVATGLLAAAVAGGATVLVAAAGQVAGISLEVGGAPIPLSGFAGMTVICSIIGLVLAAVLARVARHPRTAFVRTTVVLTVVSLVPDLLAPHCLHMALLLASHAGIVKETEEHDYNVQRLIERANFCLISRGCVWV